MRSGRSAISGGNWFFAPQGSQSRNVDPEFPCGGLHRRISSYSQQGGFVKTILRRELGRITVRHKKYSRLAVLQDRCLDKPRRAPNRF